jgi:hypothetical protein
VSQQELLIGVAAALDAQAIAYMLTGSMASSFYGEPRLTHDIDIVVQVTAQGALKLADSFPPPRCIEEMVRQDSMFNLIDTHSGDKVDFCRLATGLCIAACPYRRAGLSTKRSVRATARSVASHSVA